MNRQSLIDHYFKEAKGNPQMDKKVKKRSLSLTKPATPNKTPKLKDINVNDIINLCSDDEDIWDNTPKTREPCVKLTQRTNNIEDSVSECSASTDTYSPGKYFQSPNTPRKNTALTTVKKEPQSPQMVEQAFGNFLLNNDTAQSTPRTIQPHIKLEPLNGTPHKSSFETPKKLCCSTPQSAQASSDKSPQSKEKFFSPVRKRSIVKRPANKAKRRLSTEMSRSISSRILFEDDLFANSCEGMDDKTIFLLEIINKYLSTPSLKRLLDIDAQTLLTNCLQVVKPGMRLVCRLYWRKEGWYKKEQVTHICGEDTDFINGENFEEMITFLVNNGLVVQSNSQNMTFDHFVSILKKDELKDICKDLKMNINSKQDAIEALRNFSKRSSNISHFLTGYTSSNSRRVLQMMSNKAGPCYKLSDLAHTTLYKLYIIMYLGMDYSIIREKKLELTLIYDKIKRETYPINKDMVLDDASVVFKNKDEFERYLAAHQIYEDYITNTDVNTKCNTVKQVYSLYKDISAEEMERFTTLPQWLIRYTPASLYIKILENGIQELKKDKQESHYELCLEILDCLICQNTFRQHKKAEWFAEKALILHNCLSRYDEAAEVLLEGLRSDLSEEAKDHMRPRAKKIASQKNTALCELLREELHEYGTKRAILEKDFESKHIEKQPMERLSKRGKVKFETRTAGGRTVQDAEEYCIAHYICTGEFTHGEHWEGRIVTSLFFLLFWDIIYTKPARVRGIFLSHYQMYPLDLFTDSFYLNRKEAIDDWLDVIETASEDKLVKILHDSWSRRPEHELSGFSRGSMSWEQVRAVATCLGGKRLAAVCRKLATTYRYSHSGFPDLSLWHIHTKKIKFVEVKTDTDKPSTKQLQWMQYLRSASIETEFCYVGVNTTRQRCRLNMEPVTPKVKKERKKRTKVKKSPSQDKDDSESEFVVKTEM